MTTVKSDKSVYKICSSLDNTALDLDGTNGKLVINYKFHGGSNQLWRAALNDEGVVLTVLQPKPQNKNRVIELNMENDRVQFSDDINGLHQKWYLEEVDRNTFVVWNLATQKCLQNNGAHKQVTAVDPNKGITARHKWKIEPL